MGFVNSRTKLSVSKCFFQGVCNSVEVQKWVLSAAVKRYLKVVCPIYHIEEGKAYREHDPETKHKNSKERFEPWTLTAVHSSHQKKRFLVINLFNYSTFIHFYNCLINFRFFVTVKRYVVGWNFGKIRRSFDLYLAMLSIFETEFHVFPLDVASFSRCFLNIKWLSIRYEWAFWMLCLDFTELLYFGIGFFTGI